MKRRAKEPRGILGTTVLKVKPAFTPVFHKQTRCTSGSYTPNFYALLFAISILLLSHLVLHLQMALRSQFVILFKYN